MNLTWTYSSFDELNPATLYAILRLRSEVFVVEQNCVYQDMDNKDEKSKHLAAWNGNHLAAYCRILPPGVSYPEASIGRVLTSGQNRKEGIGRQLMEKAIQITLDEFQTGQICIGAQLYLRQFYTSLGFKQISETYLEDDIPHITMLLTA